MARHHHSRSHKFSLRSGKHSAPAASLPHAVGPQPASAAQDLRRGLAAFECGDYSQAIQAWKQAQRAAGPADAARTARSLAEAHFRRALAATNAARQAQDLKDAVQLAPERAVYHFHLGLACLRQGQHRSAAAAFEAAHRLEPGDARMQYHFVLAALANDQRPISDDRLLPSPAHACTEAMSRLDALTALRQNEPARAVAGLGGLSKRSPLANLAFGIAQLAEGHPLEALEALVPLGRSRASLTNEAREAAAIATVAARLGTRNSRTAMHDLRRLEPPTGPALRTAFTTVARRVAQECVLDERLEDGLQACELALAAAPDHMPSAALVIHLHEVLGTRAAQRSDFDAAAQHWAAALAATSEAWVPSRILHNLALAEEQLERWEQASGHWERLAHLWKKELRTAAGVGDVSAELRRRLAVVYRHLAATYEAADDVHNAARSLESALHFDPSQLDLPLRAAELYLETEDYPRAIDHLRRALAAHPDDTRIMATLGSAYDLKGDDRQAQRYLEEALALEPANQAVRNILAGVYHTRGHRMLDGGQGKRAAVEFQRGVELDPSAAEHYECLGEAYLAQGCLDAAAKVFKVALALEGSSATARVQIGKAYLAHGFEEEATKSFRQALRASRAAHVRVAIGLVYLQHGRQDQAYEHFEQVRKTRDPRANAAVARIFIDAEREAEAIPYLERAVALDPLDSGALLDLAYALAFARRDYDRAAGELAAAERAATLSGDNEAMPEIETARRLLDRMKLAATSHARAVVER